MNTRRRRTSGDEFAKAGKEPRRRGCKPKAKSEDENVNFWHVQHEDGTELSGEEVAKIRAKTKKIWRTLCDKHGPMGSPWTLISPTCQLKYYLKIEAKYPILRLCENHYKAESIAFTDYSHWFPVQYPGFSSTPDPDPNSKPSQPCKCSHTASPKKSHKFWPSHKKRHCNQELDEELDDEDDDKNEDPVLETDRDIAGHNDDDHQPCQLPFSPPRRLPRRATTVRSFTPRKSSNATPLSVNPVLTLKPKPKPHPIHTTANSGEGPVSHENETQQSDSLAGCPSPPLFSLLLAAAKLKAPR